jgi:hypothetical protein
MIDCPFRTEQGSCQHIDAAVGLPIIIDESACAFCIKTSKDVESRSQSYPVLNLAHSERKKRGLEVGPVPRFEPETTTEAAGSEQQKSADETPAASKPRKAGCSACSKKGPQRVRPE